MSPVCGTFLLKFIAFGALNFTRETAPSTKFYEGKKDSVRPSALIGAVKCSKLRIYALHNHLEALRKVATLQD